MATLEYARSVVTNSIGNPSTSNDNIDQAILSIGKDFVRQTRCTRLINSALSLTADTQSLDFSGVTDFKARYVDWIELDHPTDTDNVRNKVMILPYESWKNVDDEFDPNLYYNGSRFGYTGTAGGHSYHHICTFQDDTTALFYPSPEVAWDVRFAWTPPFTSFTVGTGTPASVTLNVPDDVLDGMLMWGVASYLDSRDPSTRAASQGHQEYLRHIRRVKGEVNYGGSVFFPDQRIYQ